jgi:hypothetical protein
MLRRYPRCHHNRNKGIFSLEDAFPLKTRNQGCPEPPKQNYTPIHVAAAMVTPAPVKAMAMALSTTRATHGIAYRESAGYN